MTIQIKPLFRTPKSASFTPVSVVGPWRIARMMSWNGSEVKLKLSSGRTLSLARDGMGRLPMRSIQLAV